MLVYTVPRPFKLQNMPPTWEPTKVQVALERHPTFLNSGHQEDDLLTINGWPLLTLLFPPPWREIWADWCGYQLPLTTMRGLWAHISQQGMWASIHPMPRQPSLHLYFYFHCQCSTVNWAIAGWVYPSEVGACSPLLRWLSSTETLEMVTGLDWGVEEYNESGCGLRSPGHNTLL